MASVLPGILAGDDSALAAGSVTGLVRMNNYLGVLLIPVSWLT